MTKDPDADPDPAAVAAAIYARRSQEQPGMREEAKSVSRQIEGARAWIAQRGWTLDEDHIYKDDGVSGFLFAGRPSFQAMLQAATSGALQALVLFDLDRFGRNSRRTMEALYALDDLGIAVWDYSTSRSVDLESFEGRVLTTLQAEFSQQYFETIRKKVLAAIHAKARRGEWCGGRPYGYKSTRSADGKKDLIPEPSEAQTVRGILERFAAGAGLHEIARWLNEQQHIPAPRSAAWNTACLRGMLRNPICIGRCEYGKTRVKRGREAGGRERAQRPTPPEDRVVTDRPDLRIISDDLWQRVQARLAAAQRQLQEALARGATAPAPHKAAPKYLLSGLLICPACGGGFIFRHTGFKRVGGAYICSGRYKRPGSCKCRFALPREEAERSVLAVLRQALFNPDRELLLLVPDAAARERLRVALLQRGEELEAVLQQEPTAARALLIRLLGPITFVWDKDADQPVWLLLDVDKPEAGRFPIDVSGTNVGLIPWTAELFSRVLVGSDSTVETSGGRSTASRARGSAR